MRTSPAPPKSVPASVSTHPLLVPYVRPVDSVDLDLIISGRSNALLCGPSPVLRAALSALQPHLKVPVHKLLASDCSSLSLSSGTLILEQVGSCSASQQQRLLESLDTAANRVQVIATTEPRLFDLVECGSFSDRLYYRLNTVHLDFHA